MMNHIRLNDFFAGALIIFLSMASGSVLANDYREIPVVAAGFIGGYEVHGDIDPENTPCGIWAYGSYAWDYRNVSLVLDLGSPQMVNRILVMDNIRDNKGTAAYLNKATVALYYSLDNKQYIKYNDDFDFAVKKGDGLTVNGKPVYDVIEFSNISIDARYIKLNTTYSGKGYDFLTLHEAGLLKAYQLKSNAFIADLHLDSTFLTWGINKITVTAELAPAQETTLILALKRDGRLLAEQKVPITKNGDQTINFDIKDVEPGNCTLSYGLWSADGNIRAERTMDVKLFRNFFAGQERLQQNTTIQASIKTRLLKMWHNLFAGKKPIRKNTNTLGAGDILIIEPKDLVTKTNAWQLRGYAYADTKTKGQVVVSTNVSGPIVCPLQLEGWYAIYIGLASPGSGVSVQLEGEKEGKVCSPREDYRREIYLTTGDASLSGAKPGKGAELVTEDFFKCAKLAGQNLMIKPANPKAPAALAYIKLVALTERQVKLLHGEGDISKGKQYIYTCDGYQNWAKKNIPKMVNKFAGTPDIEAMSWEVGGSVMYCPTKIGTLLGEGSDFPIKLDKEYTDSLYNLLKQGIVPVDVVTKEAHKIGIKLYAAYRMNAEYGRPFEKHFNSKFWWDHPEYRIVSTKDGTRNPHLSYVYPEVRDYKLSLLTEVLQNYDVDGIHLEFLRSAPYFGYDQPLVEGYKAQYGEDPLDPGFKPNERWYKYQAQFMTRFMEDLRKILDTEGKKRGRHLWLGVRVDYNDYLHQGLDVQTWINEGLIDMVAAGVNGLGYPYAPADVFIKMARGTKTKVYGSTSPEGIGYRDPTPEDDVTGYKFLPKSTPASLDMRRRRHLEYFKAGTDGMYMFNDGGSYFDQYANLGRWEEFEDSRFFSPSLISFTE